ncbi:MAG: hypothetical protein WC974_08445 [Thermoplasmata archaeon]
MVRRESGEMGYNRHNAIIVTSYDEKKITEAQQKAETILSDLVSPIIESRCNNFMTFFVAPDGSKEGWSDSDIGDIQRNLFTKWLDEQRYDDNSTSIDWVEVQYGDDNYETKIIRDGDTHIRGNANAQST